MEANRVIGYLKLAVAVVGTFLTTFFGGWDVMLRVLVLFVAIDYVVGVTAAWYEKKLSSEAGAKGIIKKFLLFVIVALAFQVDNAIGQEIFRSLAIWFYLANEALSIIENAGRCGVPIPAFLKTALEQMRNRANDGTTPAIDVPKKE
jgi:toxin secretion/phage lysis holin